MKNFFFFFLILLFVLGLSVKANQSEIKAVEGFSREEPLSYSGKRFYIYGLMCGIGCDNYGRNCQKGICNVKDCDIKNGYTQLKVTGKHMSADDAICYNPKTDLAYSVYSEYNYVEFYKNNIHCGENCDIDGKNCIWGICNVENCDIENGFTELNKEKELGFFGPVKEHWVCNKPSLNLSYFPTSKGTYKTFYYKEYFCGRNCDTEGKNCEYEEGSRPGIGICNPEDCPKGYEPSIGLCKKINGKKLLYKDKDGKFKNEDIRGAKQTLEMGVGFAGYIGKGLACSIFRLKCE